MSAVTLRNIVEIDEELCDGCGQCVPSCAEGALQVIEGKARLVTDKLCDGLGACLGECPQGALKVTQREAEAFDEVLAAHPVPQPRLIPTLTVLESPQGGGCPGSRVQTFGGNGDQPGREPGPAVAPGVRPSMLRQWPIQLHLVPPTAPFLRDADVLLAADCVPFAVAGFHETFLGGKALAIACPKLDQHLEIYVEKLSTMIDQAHINTLSVVVMEVPCCSGLLRLAQEAVARASRQIPIKWIVVGVRGDVLRDQWVLG